MARETERLVTCLNLRSKEMFYKDPAAPPSEHDLEVERLFGSCDTTVCWCQRTQTGRGPDDQPANRKACSQPDRTCHVGLVDLT